MSRLFSLAKVLCVIGPFLFTWYSDVAFCQEHNQHPGSASIQKDINTVLREHDRELMSIPGVVGVYVGLLPDGETPCLTVLVTRPIKDISPELPKTIEGYPVVLEFTDPIRPLK